MARAARGDDRSRDMVVASVAIATAQSPFPTHPLAPLTEAEIRTAVAVVKQASLSEEIVFPNISLQEPDKQAVLSVVPGEPFQRQAFVVVYDRSLNTTYEAVVDLNSQTLSSWKEIPEVQPALVAEDYELAEQVITNDARWQAAMQRRGISDLSHVKVECWAPGNLTESEKALGARLCRGLTYYKGDRWNYYGSPVEGVLATVNLNTGELSSLIDNPIVPFSTENWNYDAQAIGRLRPAPKALRIQQPDGASFQVEGNEIHWQNWSFRYLMHPREGLTLYQVTYKDGDTVRPVLYRASLSEMVVPYADPDPTWAFRNAFDVGEYNFGVLANSLELGKEVPENGVLLDAVFADSAGEPYAMPGVVGLYERDNGILWKHYEYNTERNDVRRSRELVMTITAAIGNYDYGINWVFHQDGTLELQADLTGIVLAQGSAAEIQAEAAPTGRLLAKNILGVNHQHFFNFRLDMDVDGVANSVMEMNVNALPLGQDNPYGNTFVMENTLLRTEAEAVRDLSMAHSREWMVASSTQTNAVGAPTGYMLMPMGNTNFFPVEGANVRQRSGFATHHFWATQYAGNELYAGGDYPNQSNPNQGLPTWVADDQSLANEDVVVWYTLGVTHVPRPEDWPVMPVHRTGFKLMPVGFFARNPALDLPDLTASSN
ncbi:MAG: primary-amine oxidase [Leptolyngbyaceae cyanobacterium SL_7_1]|nr:primary-amine oxidase [Leptolyngbyaceae cyanobacterium SL_7_1]